MIKINRLSKETIKKISTVNDVLIIFHQFREVRHRLEAPTNNEVISHFVKYYRLFMIYKPPRRFEAEGRLSPFFVCFE